MQRAVRDLHRLGPEWVLLKGGHLTGQDSTDLLFDGETITELPGRRIETRNTHGTGCTLSAAIAALLPRFDMVEAVRRAKAYLTAAIAASDRLTVGSGHGPVHHFHALWTRGRSAMTQFSEAAWQRTARLRKAIDELPFNTELAAGRLSRERFQGYIVQDALYLAQYSRILAIAGVQGTRCGNAARLRLMRAGGCRRRAGVA